MRNICAFMFVVTTVFCQQSVNAAIVNIDASSNPPEDPLFMFFAAGTYTVTPIGKADGGLYNAWYPFGGLPVAGCDASGANCTRGWAHSYQITSDEFDVRVDIKTDGRSLYATEQLALDNALGTTFTLTNDGMVGFQIRDSLHTDNIDGVSLLVEPIPIPAAIWLFGSGLVGLLGIAKRREL